MVAEVTTMDYAIRIVEGTDTRDCGCYVLYMGHPSCLAWVVFMQECSWVSYCHLNYRIGQNSGSTSNFWSTH